MTRSLLLVPLLALLLAACAGGGTPTTSIGPTSTGSEVAGGPGGEAAREPAVGLAPALAGDWVLVGGTVEGAPIGLDADTTVSMTVDAGDVAGSAGCNAYWTEVTEDAGALSIANPAATRRSCAEDVMATEHAYLSALTAVTDIDASAVDLTLSGPGVTLQFKAR